MSCSPAAWCPFLVLDRTPGLVLVLGLVVALGPGARGARGGAQALRSVSEAEALGGVSQVERADVEDVFEVGGVGGVRPQEGLQR